jgi:hypothetical protein
MNPARFERIISVLLPVALGIWIIACVWFPLTDTDIWWHLASAKLLWAHQAILRTDPFSQVSQGAPWADLHWGFQLLAFGFWKLAGNIGLVGGKSLALTVAFALAVAPHWNRRTAFLLAPLVAFGIYQIRFYLDVRPLVLTLLILAAQYAVMIWHFQGRFQRPWWLVVPLQVMLVNTQGLFPLGAFLVTCLLMGEWISRSPAERRSWPAFIPLVLTSASLWLSGFVSPYGWAGFKLPLALIGRIAPLPGNIFSSEIAENQPFLNLVKNDVGLAIPFVALLAFVLYTFYGRPWKSWFGQGLFFGACLILGLMAVRNLPLALFAGLMVAGHNLSKSTHANISLSRASGLTAFAFIVFLYIPDLRRAWSFELSGSLETPFRFPSLGVDYLAAHPLEGNIFNELRYGGYLEYRLFPKKLAFVDGRMILRSADFYRNFLRAVDHPENFPSYQHEYSLTHALLPISEDRRYLPLAAYLLREEKWVLLHCDGASALLAAPELGVSLALPLDSLPLEHPIQIEVHKRFHANLKLQALAKNNVSDLLGMAGFPRAARDIAAP